MLIDLIVSEISCLVSEWVLAYIYILADPANFVPPNFPIFLSPYGENFPPFECIRLVKFPSFKGETISFWYKMPTFFWKWVKLCINWTPPPFLREFVLHQLSLLHPCLVEISALILECCNCVIWNLPLMLNFYHNLEEIFRIILEFFPRLEKLYLFWHPPPLPPSK